MNNNQVYKAVFIFNEFDMPLFGACNVTVQDALNGYRAMWGEYSDADLVKSIAKIQTLA